MLRSIKKQLNQFIETKEENRSFDSSSHLEHPHPIRENTDPPLNGAYSHGLEHIYQLEQIDIKSIRKLSFSSKEPIPKERGYTRSVSSQKQGDPDLGLLPEGKNSLDSFILEEPIYVLNLSQHVDKVLAHLNIFLLQDLIYLDFASLIHVKGIGQGHIEEIKEKLHKYIEGKVLRGCQKIDCEAWVKSLMPLNEKKRTYLILDRFDLSHILSLSPSENVEVRRLSEENKADWIEEGKEAFCSYDRYHLFQKRFEEVLQVFLIPWIQKRNGFVKKEELLERFERLSVKKETFSKAYLFFKEIFLKGKCPLEAFMIHKNSLFFADRNRAESFDMVHRALESYFYQTHCVYPINQLITLVEREFLKSWIGFPEGFIEKVIRSSTAFNVVRQAHTLIVSCNRPLA